MTLSMSSAILLPMNEVNLNLLLESCGSALSQHVTLGIVPKGMLYPVDSMFRSLRQENPKLDASLSYIGRLCLCFYFILINLKTESHISQASLQPSFSTS